MESLGGDRNQDSEHRLAQLQSLARVGFWELDLATDTAWWSDALFRIFGLKPGSVQPGREALAKLAPADALAAIDAAFAGARETGVFKSFVHRVVLASGDERRVRWVGEVARDASGRPGRLFGVGIEVTDALAAEHAMRRDESRVGDASRMLQTVLDAIPVRVFWKDRNLEYLGCNTRFARDAGFEHPSQLLGRDDFAMGWRDQADLYRADDRAVIESGESKLNYEEPQTTPDGKILWLRTSKIPLRAANGEIFGVLGTYEDITEYKRLAEQSLHREKLEAIGRLAGGIAHDFNNLLTVVLGNVEIAQEGVRSGSPPVTELAAIKEAAERAAELTAQLLAFARKQVIKPRAVDPTAQIRTLQRLLEPLLGEQIELEVSTIEPSWRIQIDPGQFEQLLVNLAVNARDAMPNGGTLEICTDNVILDAAFQAEHPEVIPGSYVKLVVRDTGSGVDASVREHIFEPFFTTKATGEGTGLGLATCHGIVKQNSGYIWLRSDPESGAIFEIYLPRVEAEPEPEEGLPLDEEVQGGQETILLIEDEAPVRLLCAQALERLGYHVLTAASGGDALERATRYQGLIDALVTDVVLTDMRGPEIAEQLRTARPELTILYVSGYTPDSDVRSDIFEEGVNFLQKPYTLKKLGTVLRRALDAK
ncbi:MAG: ATP-binding protein [Myxococcales bacterium]|nr:ATP-binding protein [Myxococcales bacterium]MDH5565959.1 ATP-binding protein [Myxococcales bacterium]